ncbi:MAG: glutathione peroxidase [Bacteroidales bacterium]|nr:glutathione peroxidase [Bacteroidales bacterium]
MKSLLLSIFLSTLLTFTMSAQTSFYDYTVTDIDGNPFALSQLKGKKVMVVNVASKCGFTPQYEQLEALYQKYKDQNFVIIGFPANNFKEQEPGTEEEIKSFCTLNYGVTFPLMSKISVKGDDMAPLYHWLTERDLNGSSNSSVKWNFQKYLVDENGQLVEVLNPWISPDKKKIAKWIEGK